MTLPLRWAEAALNCWMNWPGLTPCWPRAGPIGGAGVAVPPGAWSLNFDVISFLAMIALGLSVLAHSIIRTSICLRGGVGVNSTTDSVATAVAAGSAVVTSTVVTSTLGEG